MQLVTGTESEEDEQSEDNEQSEDDEEYEVETIIDHKMSNGISYYEVKWKGWPSSANTWEPIGNLGKCKDLIERHNRLRGRRRR